MKKLLILLKVKKKILFIFNNKIYFFINLKLRTMNNNFISNYMNMLERKKILN